MENLKNIIFKDFGTFINTNKGEQYELNKVIIFKDNQVKVIANYFLDNFSNYQFEFLGDTQRKLKIDLTSKNHFVVKSENQSSWNDKTQYTLFLNGDLLDYNLIGLELNGERLDLVYNINGAKCSQCIGWNHKESGLIKYHTFSEQLKNINSYDLDYHSDTLLENIKELEKITKNYIKAKEKEKTYTEQDYKKMSLESGTTKEENLTMLKNNNFDIKGCN